MAANPYREALEKQLRFVAQRIVGQGVEPTPTWGISQELPELRSIVANLRPDQWSSRPDLALRGVLALAIDSLGEEKMHVGDLSYRFAARRLFGFDKLEVAHLSGKAYDNVLAELYDRARLLPSQKRARREFSETLRGRVADKLIELEASAIASRTSNRGWELSATQRKRHVIRTSLEDEIEEILGSARRRVALWGESGNGKSYIARSIAARLIEEQKSVAVVRGPAGPNAPFFEHDIREALGTIGIDPVTWSGTACLSRFADVLTKMDTFDLVVFDDVDDSTIEFFGANATVPIIVTCRDRPRIEGFWPVRIGAFNSAQSLDYWRNVGQDSDEGTRKAICARLGHRPIALHIAACLVEQGLISQSGLLEAISQDIVATLDASAELLHAGPGYSLTAVYREAIRNIATDACSGDVLRTVLWVTGSASRVYVLSASPRFDASESSQLIFAGAIARLNRIGIIDASAADIEINDLSLEILRALVADSAKRTVIGFYESVCVPGIRCAEEATDWSDLWTRIQAVMPVPNEDKVFWQRRLFALGVAVSTVVLQELAPTWSIGVLCATQRNWILWQKGSPFFATPSQDLKVALLSFDESGPRLHSPSELTQSSGRDPQFMTLLLDVVRVFRSSLHAFLRRFSNSGASTRRPGLVRGVDDSETLVHKFFTPIREAGWGALEFPVWTICGLLLTPKADPTAKRCEECEGGIEPGQEEEFISVLVAFDEVIARANSTARWEVRWLVSSTLGMVQSGKVGYQFLQRASSAIPMPDADPQRAVLSAYTAVAATAAQLGFEKTERLEGMRRASGLLRSIAELLPPEIEADCWTKLGIVFLHSGLADSAERELRSIMTESKRAELARRIEHYILQRLICPGQATD